VRYNHHTSYWIFSARLEPDFGAFLVRFGPRISQFYWVLCAPGGDLGPVFGWFSTVHLAVDFTRVWPPVELENRLLLELEYGPLLELATGLATFRWIWGTFLALVFGVRPFEYLPVYRCFLDLGCWPRPLFRPVLDPVLDRISRHSKI
jgi:hypothetical protein